MNKNIRMTYSLKQIRMVTIEHYNNNQCTDWLLFTKQLFRTTGIEPVTTRFMNFNHYSRALYQLS